MNICIIGFGRFGKLLYKILRSEGKIFILDKKQNTAKDKQINYAGLRSMDWIILAVPISSLEKILQAIKPFLRPGSLVMDVCSVKVYPVKLMKKYLPADVDILATHPLFGPDSAKYGFKGLSMVFCPIRIKNSQYLSVRRIFQNLKIKCIKMTPAAHDREAAISLSLVHFLGRGLGKIGIKSQQVSTLGFERLLSVNETVTNDTWRLFRDMHKYNPYAATARRKLLSALVKLDKNLQN